MSGILTAAGEAAFAASVGGAAVSFAAVRVGDGNGAAITPLRTMTDLVHRVGQAYPIISSARDADNPTYWRITTEIPAGQGPFTVREIAVFDTAGSMLAIASHPVVEFVGPGAGQVSIITDIVFPVSGTANVAVTISPSSAVPLARNLRAFFMSVESATTVAPPETPAVGASYIVPAAATGAWAGQAGNIAQWTGESWSVATVPVGHVVCVMDQAANADGRFQRRIATGWTTAKATDAAYGFARLATAAEVENKTAGVAVPADKLIWSLIGDKPATFAPDPHTHDYLPLAGGNVTGPVNGTSLTLSATLTGTAAVFSGVHQVTRGDNGNAYQVNHTTGGTVAALCPVSLGGGNYGLGLFGYATASGVGGYRVVFDHMGRSGFGTSTPTERVDVVGNIALSGALKLASGFGAANQVPISAASGPNTWANVIDLVSATQLRAKIGGQTVWAAVHCWGAKPANGTVPANFRARGCTITTNEFSSGNPLMVVTFASAAPDTSYIVVPDGGAVSAKTTTGFTYALGNLTTSAPEITVYL